MFLGSKQDPTYILAAIFNKTTTGPVAPNSGAGERTWSRPITLPYTVTDPPLASHSFYQALFRVQMLNPQHTKEASELITATCPYVRIKFDTSTNNRYR
jgi:hypothetical protein